MCFTAVRDMSYCSSSKMKRLGIKNRHVLLRTAIFRPGGQYSGPGFSPSSFLIAQQNEKPKPYRWAKSADTILAHE
jgi:hypothetical protein